VAVPRPLYSDNGVRLELGLAESDRSIGNQLQLVPEDRLANLHRVQTRHGLKPRDRLAPRDFTVEMETCIGRTPMCI
jgi:type III restriction enzyme